MLRQIFSAVALAAFIAALSSCGRNEQCDATPHAHCDAAPSGTSGNTLYTGTTWGNEEQRATVRTWIQRLMNETRIVPGSYGKPDSPRGSPGQFEKLPGPVVEEYISALLYAGEMFMPKSLKWDERTVLLASEVSIESAFVTNTAGANPGNMAMTSVGPLQWTKEIWTPIFKKQAQIPGLTHYDGSVWNPADTTDEMVINSVWDNIVASAYVITQQGRQGAPDELHGQDGPMPKQFFTGCLCWVLGCGAAKTGGDLAEQRQPYRHAMATDLKMLGYPESLLDTNF